MIALCDRPVADCALSGQQIGQGRRAAEHHAADGQEVAARHAVAEAAASVRSAEDGEHFPLEVVAVGHPAGASKAGDQRGRWVQGQPLVPGGEESLSGDIVVIPYRLARANLFRSSERPLKPLPKMAPIRYKTSSSTVGDWRAGGRLGSGVAACPGVISNSGR